MTQPQIQRIISVSYRCDWCAVKVNGRSCIKVCKNIKATGGLNKTGCFRPVGVLKVWDEKKVPEGVMILCLEREE